MFYRWEDKNLILNCNIQPKSSEDRVVGLLGKELKIRITAAPTDGKANKHLIRFIAKQFAVKQSAITIVTGHSSRHKSLCIESPAKIPESFQITIE